MIIRCSFIILINLFIVICSSNISKVKAEYNADKLGEALGGYLISVDMMEKLEASRCGYILSRKYSFNNALSEVLPYLKQNDATELKAFIKSQKFQGQLKENEEYIQGFLVAGKKDGLDEKTLCGMISSNISMVYQKALQKWNYTKKHYSKQR